MPPPEETEGGQMSASDTSLKVPCLKSLLHLRGVSREMFRCLKRVTFVGHFVSRG